MKNLSLLHRLTLTVAGALALGACNRSEYAMLPKSSAYLHSTAVAAAPRTAAPVAATPTAPVATASVAPAIQPEPLSSAVVTTAPATAATATVTPRHLVAAPVATASTEFPATVVATPAAPTKLNLVQRLALKKITKKLDKLAAKTPQLRQRSATAGTARIEGNLRTAIVLGVVGLILTILGSVAGIFYVIGTILVVIGLIFLLLWLLDQA